MWAYFTKNSQKGRLKMSLRPRVDYFHYFTNKERLFKERVARLKQLAKNGSALEVKRELDKLKTEIEDVKTVRDTYRAAIKQLRKTGECEVNVSGYTIIDAPSLPSIRIREFQENVKECNKVIRLLNWEASILRFELARRKIHGSVTLPILKSKAKGLNQQMCKKLISLKKALQDLIYLLQDISQLNREFAETQKRFERFNLNPKTRLLDSQNWFLFYNRLSYELSQVKQRVEFVLREIEGEID